MSTVPSLQWLDHPRPDWTLPLRIFHNILWKNCNHWNTLPLGKTQIISLKNETDPLRTNYTSWGLDSMHSQREDGLPHRSRRGEVGCTWRLPAEWTLARLAALTVRVLPAIILHINLIGSGFSLAWKKAGLKGQSHQIWLYFWVKKATKSVKMCSSRGSTGYIVKGFSKA